MVVVLRVRGATVVVVVVVVTGGSGTAVVVVVVVVAAAGGGIIRRAPGRAPLLAVESMVVRSLTSAGCERPLSGVKTFSLTRM